LYSCGTVSQQIVITRGRPDGMHDDATWQKWLKDDRLSRHGSSKFNWPIFTKFQDS